MKGIFDRHGKYCNSTAFISILIFLVSSSFMTWFILFVDDTNYGTGNGLWKAVWINDYIFEREKVDYQNLYELSFVTNLFYFPVYAWLIEYSPLRYFDLITVQKMAIINAWFGGLSLAAFYLMMFQFIRNHNTALIATLAHLAGGIFFSVSTNSEDIISSYAFFVISLLGVILYLRSGSTKHLVLTATAYAISWLFHWTMAFGPMLAYALVIMLKQQTIKNMLKHWGIFALTNIVIVAASAIYWNASFFQIFYAGKVMDSGWITGFSWEKPVLLYTGFINYIIGGFQFLGMEHFLDTLLGGPWYYPSFIVASVIFFVLTAHILFFFIKRRKDKLVSGFGAFLLINFLIAQIMNMIEFATDLQFHIQPMIWLPISFGLLYYSLIHFEIKISLLKTIPKSLILAAFMFMPFILMAYNIIKFRLPGRVGLDSYYISQLKQVEANTDLENTFFVTRGWDEFRNWGYSYWGSGFRNNTITITDFLRDYPRESVEAAHDRFVDTVANRISSGFTVLTGPEIVDRDEYEILFIFENFKQTDKTKMLLNTVRNEFKLTPVLETELGTFYQIQLE